LQVCKQVVTNLFTSYQQVVLFPFLVTSLERAEPVNNM
jgi:hypothetical protein